MKYLRKSVCLAIIPVTAFLAGACPSENITIAPPESETPQTLAVPAPIEVVETPQFKALKKQFETAETEVKRLENQRIRLLTTYTEAHPKVKKLSAELAKAREKLKSGDKLLNAEREKLEYRFKNSPV